jgi:hypothetical protein
MKAYIPSPAQLARLPEPVQKAATETASLREKHSKARQDLVELEHARDRAKQTDTETAAAALRSGKKAPAPKLAKAQAAIDEAEPKVDALALAAKQAEDDLLSAIGDCSEEVRSALFAESNDQKAEARVLAEQIGASMRKVEATLALAQWLKDPTRTPGRYLLGDLPGIRQQNGEPVTVQLAAAELEAGLAPPPETQTPNVKPRPLQQVPR